MNCEFEGVGDTQKCVRCGRIVKFSGTIHARCVKQKPCPYFGQPREETLTVELLCGCKNNRQRSSKTFIVHDCAVNGRCLPGYTCSPDAVETFVAGEWAEPCKGCAKRPT